MRVSDIVWCSPLVQAKGRRMGCFSNILMTFTGLEFAYTQAPEFMQGLIMGLFLMTSGIGSYVASLIVTIVQSWRTSGMY